MFLLGVYVTRRCFTVTGCCGGGLSEEVSLMLAWEIHNHWSHCWARIRPAVSSLKGQKSIPLHYRAGAVVITHTSSAEQEHMHTHPYSTNMSLSLGSLYVFWVKRLSFILIMWLRGDGLYCDTRPFSEEKCISLFLRSNKQPSVLQWRQRSMLQALSDDLWANFSWTD